ncbi:hypothetical protein U9M48_034696 [Paspalum notatum var. saurae]|uniref:Pectinesterase inhibitor domain-containing protein n=1 Tax=Paspalum notatum var. saurae TaxID=547442 RepID=A0AAQ3UBD3_PASNO
MKTAMAAGTLTPTSSSSVSIAILLSALLVAGTHAEVTSDVPSTLLPACKTVGGGSAFFDVEFCVAALGSDGRSANAGASYHTYSVVAADLLAANATATAAKISRLLREGGVGGEDAATARRLRLRSCQALYGGVVRAQPACAAAVRATRKGEATACLERAASAVRECEDGFGKSKVASPVTAENDAGFKLAKLAVALLRYV